MKLVLRVSFLVLVLLAIRERVVWYRLGAAAADPLTSLAGRLNAMGLRNDGPDRNGLMQVSAPGCGVTFPVGLFALDGGEDARIAGLLPPDSKPLYIYLGAVEPTRAQVHPVAAWLGASIATMAGRRDTQPPRKLVMSALPAKCGALAGLDWASLSR
jgi:hypothetical protein